MKRMLIIALALMFCASASATTVMVVSDIHYMDRSLYEGSDLFLRVLRTGDGKLTQHSDELMAALAAEADRLRPDALIVTGDLTFNGERVSHESLAGWFARIEALGVPVWVIPGNHDINCADARGFRDDGWYAVDAVTPEAFSAIYADHMLPPEGEAGLSYLAPIDDTLSVAMTDVACYQGGAQTFGLFLAGHAAWLEDAAGRCGSPIITATHHNLLPHTQFMQDAFVMFGSETLLGTMKALGIRVNLSGHIHAQHIASRDGVTDAATGAFCNWPHRFALLTVTDGAAEYRAEALDQDLLPEGFSDMSRAWFTDIARAKVLSSLGEGAEAEAMADYAARFNLAYFSGTYRRDDAAWREDPAYALWRQQEDSPFWQYMDMVMNEPGGDNLRFACRLD